VFCGSLGQNFVPSSKIPHWLIFCEGTITKNIWKPWTAVGLSMQIVQRVNVLPSVNMCSLIEPLRRNPISSSIRVSQARRGTTSCLSPGTLDSLLRASTEQRESLLALAYPSQGHISLRLNICPFRWVPISYDGQRCLRYHLMSDHQCSPSIALGR
jgi:hypothetical protein